MSPLHQLARTHRRCIAAAALAGTLAVGAAISTSSASANRQHAAIATTPAVAWSGANSAIEEPRFVLVGNQREWASLWLEHIGQRADRDARGRPFSPEIDWDRYAVLAVFLGPMKRTNAVTLVSVTDAPDGSLTIARFDRRAFQTNTIGAEPNEGPSVMPFGLFVVPRPAGAEVVFEVNTQNLIGRPSVWTEKARIKGLPPLPARP